MCGISFIRLKKPIDYYYSKYGTSFYGLNKLHLLMEKQHNRGQDGAGAACLKIDVSPGNPYINMVRSNEQNPINDIFSKIHSNIEKKIDYSKDINWIKENVDFTGEIFMGHLRYGTYGGNNIELTHPVIRENNWKSRNLILSGNFNMTNVNELIQRLIDIGQHPIEETDTITILENIGHFLDKENEELYKNFKIEYSNRGKIANLISNNIDVEKILKESSKNWDGGYTIVGVFGHGDSFIFRDEFGIRPAYYYENDEIITVASERPTIQTTFNCDIDDINEIKPGHALIIKKDGSSSQIKIKESTYLKPCSFERIYFSRGTDKDIYTERKKLGKFLTYDILKSVDYDIKNTVFSYVPNTASIAFQGLIEELNKYCDYIKKDKILSINSLNDKKLENILKIKPRIENVIIKDTKMRTFITEDNKRDELVRHIYDVTYGIINDKKDNIVVLDDSIVRGTTLKQSIVRSIDKLNPKHIIIASSAPQIRYPDCYGIDMARLGDLIAFNAAICLLKENSQNHIIYDTYKKCKKQEHLPKEKINNYVKNIYKPFSNEDISKKISQIVTNYTINSKVTVIYQTIENLHKSIPNHKGDWYFTGDYPTYGGNKVVNNSFINYIEGKNNKRPY